jgi:phosphoserine phosphatase
VAEGEDLDHELCRLERQASELEQQIHAVNADAVRWKAKRDALNLAVKRRREEAERYRASRNGHNDAVKTSQVVRDALQRTLLEKRRAVARDHRRLASLLATTSTSESLLMGRKRELEWAVQTSTLSPEEEAELIDTIRSVERALIVHREASTVQEHLRTCLAEIESITLRIEDANLRLARSVAASQEDHAKMREALTALHDARERADDAHRRYLDGRQASVTLHEELTALVTRITTVTRGLEARRRETLQRRAHEDATARTDATLDRLKKKRRIPLADFKELKKRGLIQEYE